MPLTEFVFLQAEDAEFISEAEHLSRYGQPHAELHNFNAITDPTINDDVSLGYSVGSRWINLATGYTYTCTDATLGAAVWYSPNEVGDRANDLRAGKNAGLYKGILVRTGHGHPAEEQQKARKLEGPDFKVTITDSLADCTSEIPVF